MKRETEQRNGTAEHGMFHCSSAGAWNNGTISADAVFRALLGEPIRSLSRGAQWRYGSKGSLVVDIKRGLWCDHEAGEGGGVLDLVRRVRGGSRADASAWLQGETGLATNGTRTTTKRLAVAFAGAKPARNPASVAGQWSGGWAALWRASHPPQDTPVAAYLAGRGLCLPADAGRMLRYHPACPFGSERLPAMVALIRNAQTDEAQGVHRTALTLAGERARGADGAKRAKMMLGKAAGGAVKLSADCLVESGLGLAEGVETGLAALQRAPWLPTWAALSAGGVAGFPVLRGIERLVIYADNDRKPDGRNPGLEAARACARRWAAAGRSATVEYVRGGGDFADVALSPGLPLCS